MKKIWHGIMHIFGMNTGQVYTWWDSDTGDLMVGFRCNGCERIDGVHKCFRG